VFTRGGCGVGRVACVGQLVITARLEKLRDWETVRNTLQDFNYETGAFFSIFYRLPPPGTAGG
jgi:hypothetical protein